MTAKPKPKTSKPPTKTKSEKLLKELVDMCYDGTIVVKGDGGTEFIKKVKKTIGEQDFYANIMLRVGLYDVELPVGTDVESIKNYKVTVQLPDGSTVKDIEVDVSDFQE